MYLCISTELKFQDNWAGALEVFRNTQQFYVRQCMNEGAKQRGSYTGPDGKDKIWTFLKMSGDSPELAAFVEGQEKFKVVMSDSYCTDGNWRNRWSRNVAKIKFAEMDEASVQFRIGKHHDDIFLFIIIMNFDHVFIMV